MSHMLEKNYSIYYEYASMSFLDKRENNYVSDFLMVGYGCLHIALDILKNMESGSYLKCVTKADSEFLMMEGKSIRRIELLW